ncbi:hypothetical protein BDF22DRAFT_672135 [Syncephalis plumigaleata]|nr:hypothetical protein BDF22DRAFT_672135 [Syncephalis plumigaleata]
MPKRQSKSNKNKRQAGAIEEGWQVVSAEDKITKVVDMSPATDDSDDEAPEAVSLSTSKQQVEIATRQAQIAADEKAAELRRKRRAVDTRLKSQRKERDERKPSVAPSQQALPAELLDSVAELDEQKKQQQQARHEEMEKKRASRHMQFDSDDDVTSDEEVYKTDLALPGGMSQSSGQPMDWARGTRPSSGDIGRQKRARNETKTINKSGIQVAVLKTTPTLSKSIDSSAVKFKKRCLHGKRIPRGDALRHSAFRRLAIPLQFTRK